MNISHMLRRFALAAMFALAAPALALAQNEPPGVKIGSLPSAPTLNGSEVIPCSRSMVTSGCSAQQILNFVLASPLPSGLTYPSGIFTGGAWTGGTIDGACIGCTTPGAGNFTTLGVASAGNVAWSIYSTATSGNNSIILSNGLIWTSGSLQIAGQLEIAPAAASASEIINAPSNSYSASVDFYLGGVFQWELGQQSGADDYFFLYNGIGAGGFALKIDAVTDAAAFGSTAASTSTGTGAIVDAGGLGVAGAAFIGGTINNPAGTGTPAASLCLDASNNIIKKTTTGPCV